MSEYFLFEATIFIDLCRSYFIIINKTLRIDSINLLSYHLCSHLGLYAQPKSILELLIDMLTIFIRVDNFGSVQPFWHFIRSISWANKARATHFLVALSQDGVFQLVLLNFSYLWVNPCILKTPSSRIGYLEVALDKISIKFKSCLYKMVHSYESFSHDKKHCNMTLKFR